MCGNGQNKKPAYTILLC